MKNKKVKVAVLVTLPVELKRELTEESQKAGRSLNNFVSWQLMEFLKEKKK